MNLLCFSGKYSRNSSLNYISDLNQVFSPLLRVKFLVDSTSNSLILKQLDQSILNNDSSPDQIKSAPEGSSKRILTPKDLKGLGPKQSSPITFPVDMSFFIKEAYNLSKNGYAKLSVASRRRKLSTLKNFSLWCLDNEYITSDPLKGAPSGKLPERLPEYLNLDEVMVYFKSILSDYNKEPSKYKNEFLNFLVLYGCGLRIEEACTIKTKDIDWTQSRISILGKGSKTRFAILPDFVKDKMQSLIEEEKPYIYGDQALVPRTAYNWIKKRGLKAGLHKPVHPHMFRHTYATHLLREKTDLRHLQELLGHSSLVATQRYTHLDKNQLLQSLEDFHPLSKNKI